MEEQKDPVVAPSRPTSQLVLAPGLLVGLETANEKALFRVKSFGNRVVVLEAVPGLRIVKGRVMTETERAELAARNAAVNQDDNGSNS